MIGWLNSATPWTLKAAAWAGALAGYLVPKMPVGLQLQFDLLAFLLFWFLYPSMVVLASPELGATSIQRRRALFGVVSIVAGAIAAAVAPTVGRALARAA